MLGQPLDPYDDEQRGLGLGQLPSPALPRPDFRVPTEGPQGTSTGALQGLSRVPFTAPTGYTPKPIDPAIAAYVSKVRPKPTEPTEPTVAREAWQARPVKGLSEATEAKDLEAKDPDKALKVIDTLLGGLASLGPQGSDRPIYDEAYWDRREQSREAKTDKAKAEAEKAKALREADPTSPESKAAQASWAKWLNQAGWQPQDIATLSAEQARGLDLNRLVSERERVRREAGNRQVESALAGAKLKEQRAYEKAVRDEEQANRIALEKEKDALRDKGKGSGYGAPPIDPNYRQQVIAALANPETGKPDPIVQARIDGADRLPPNKRAAEYQRILAESGRVDRQTDAQENRTDIQDKRIEAQAQAKLDDRVKYYGKDLNESGIPVARATAKRIRDQIAKQKADNNGQIFSLRDELVRRGPDSTAGLASEGAKPIIADVQALQNIKIKNTSGQAVTLSEMPRVQKAMGTGLFSNEADLERFLAVVEEELAATQEGWDRTYGPEVVEAYRNPESRQPRVSTQGAIGSRSSQPSRVTRIRDPKTGRTGNYEGTPEEAQAEGFEVVK